MPKKSSRVMARYRVVPLASHEFCASIVQSFADIPPQHSDNGCGRNIQIFERHVHFCSAGGTVMTLSFFGLEVKRNWLQQPQLTSWSNLRNKCKMQMTCLFGVACGVVCVPAYGFCCDRHGVLVQFFFF